ncbi:MAG: hypothetical protein HY073_00670 [Deltaproteobacteria bacterium]|nr:hypothetical protein [Deltaproteobacteria bacterium]
MNAELIKPFYRVFTMPPQQWHPVLIHFPIVFLEIEAFFLILFAMKKNKEYEKWAHNFLKITFWSLFVVAAAGFHDCGLVLGTGNKFLLGIQDRWENAFRFQSTITVHFWLAVLTFVIVLLRFVWQSRNPKVLQGKGAYLYGFMTVMGIWSLLATSYVGGMMSHK